MYLHKTCPTQADLETAYRTLEWLSVWAHFFPEECGQDDAKILQEAATIFVRRIMTIERSSSHSGSANPNGAACRPR
jgi:hypothetical protein